MKILGIDMGISSLGWALVEENRKREDNKIIDTGVRIFTKAENPKTGASLALPRREQRGARRVIRRKVVRMKAIKNLLIDHLALDKKDLFTSSDKGSETIYKAKNKKDIWLLRKEGLERKLTNKELARILTHIAKRRGYKSNAKSDASDDEGKKVLSAIAANKKEMTVKNCTTIGQFLYQKKLEESTNSEKPVKIRNTENVYKQCVERDMLEDELQEIFDKQKEFGNDLSNLLEQYKEIAFKQNPLKSSIDMVGNCTFEKDEKRAPKQCYSAELFVALTTVINLGVLVDKDNKYKKYNFLDKFNIDEVIKILHTTKEVKYSTLRNKLKIPTNLVFKGISYTPNVERNTKLPTYKKIIEQETWLNEQQKEKISWIPEKKNPSKKRQKIRYLLTYADLKNKLNLASDFKFTNVKYLDSKSEIEIMKAVEDKSFGSLKGYHTIKNKIKDDNLFEKIFTNKNLFNEIAVILATEKDTEKTYENLKTELEKQNFNDEQIKNIAKNLQDTSFDKFNNLSITAIDKLLPYLKQGKKYNEACYEVYGHHSFFEKAPQKFLRKLNKQENYQLTNPVVKRAFAQFRKILNAIIRKHGQFDAMHIEMSRELKNSYKKRKEIEEGQEKFRVDKETIKNNFIENYGRDPTGTELLKFRLYNEQASRSMYSGEKIDTDRLISGTEIDHILPYSRSFDNSFNNKVLVLASENQNKGDKTPFEYLVNKDETSEVWYKFKQRVNTYHDVKGMKKRNLFNTMLAERRGSELTEDDTEKEDSFIARNLIDTQFLSKFTKNFVENNLLFRENSNIKQKVKVRSGSLTSHLRYIWGIQDKNRENHFHHAEDAIIIAFSTQKEVQRLSTLSAKEEGFKYSNKEEKAKYKKEKSTAPFDYNPNKKNDFDEKVQNIFVSFAPRRKVTGAAHEETLYSTSFTVKSKGKTKEIKGSTKLYPQELNKNKDGKPRALAKKGGMPRIDIFQHKENKKYYIVPIYVADFVKDKLPNKAIVPGNNKDGTKKEWLDMNDNYQFIVSFYKDDLIEVIDKKQHSVKGYFGIVDSNSGVINIKNIKGKTKENFFDKKKGKYTNLIKYGMGIQKVESIKKYQVSPLGKLTQVKLPEKRIGSQKELRIAKNKKAINNN